MRTIQLERWSKTPYLKPVNADDLPIFMHCCSGSNYVAPEYLEEVCRAVFLEHGIKIRIQKERKPE